MGSPFAREVTVSRDATAERNSLGRWAFLLTTCVNAGSCMAGPVAQSTLLGLLAFGSFLLFPLCLHFLFAGLRRPTAPADLSIDGETLVLVQRGAHTSIPFAKIRGAWVEKNTYVAIVTRGETVTMNLSSHTDIQNADPDPAGVRITRKDGSKAMIAFTQGADAAAVWVERQFALLSRIEWWKENGARTAQEAKLAVLDRAGRSPAPRGGSGARDRRRGEPSGAAHRCDRRAVGDRSRTRDGKNPRRHAHVRGPEAAGRIRARRSGGRLRFGLRGRERAGSRSTRMS